MGQPASAPRAGARARGRGRGGAGAGATAVVYEVLELTELVGHLVGARDVRRGA